MFSGKIRELRTSKGISQVELANHLGVAQQTVGKWEKNIAMPGVDTLEAVADYFGVSTDYLLGRPELVYHNKRKPQDNHTPIYSKDTMPNNPPSYYDDPETMEMANQMKDDPDYRTLFHAKKKLPPEKMEVYMEMLKGMIGEND